MTIERTDVKYPLWRKKVDSSLFAHLGTTIPNWVCRLWNIPGTFSECTSKKSTSSHVVITFEEKSYEGSVTAAQKGRSNPAYRLWYDEELLHRMKHTFLMSYMRHLEGELRKQPGKKIKIRSDVEEEIPFWEFLDIEYEQEKRVFHFSAHYKKKPLFPNLFSFIQGTPTLERVEDYIIKDPKARIYKQPWYPRSLLEKRPEEHNVIYYLLDSKNKLLYVGEAKRLKQRLASSHPSIPDWDYFRFDVLPDELQCHRVALERMQIRAFASMFASERTVSAMILSDYRLANKKIDV